MSSLEAGRAAKDGIKKVFPKAICDVLPIADGGEGTVQALIEGMGGDIQRVTVKNPLGRDIVAEYGIVNKTAIIEMAVASGIALLGREELNPMETTTYGVGQLIKDAILKNCRDFIIGIGGSATNDGGVGMLKALGFKFKDKDGKEIGYGAKELGRITEIDDLLVIPELKECKFNIACDVTNPLCGENGCSKIFAPQKGANEREIMVMDKGMKKYGELTMNKYKNADMNFPGAGAAGGLGFAFMAYLKGELKSGIELILDKIGIEEYIKDADLVITGEGRIDSQTAMGKAPVGIAELAKKYNKNVFAFCGSATRDAGVCNERGIDGIFPIVRGVCTLDEAMDTENAKANMRETVEQVMRLYKIQK